MSRKQEIEDLKQAVSLLQVVGAKVKLEQRGEEWWGCCPFHNEKTPSFAIKNKGGDQVFFCQGCGKGGDVIRFIEYIDNCTTKDALDKMRALSGNAEWQASAARVQEVFKPVAEATQPKKTFPVEKWGQFSNALQANRAALKWLLDVRGITAETAAGLQIGFCQEYKGHLDEKDEHVRNGGWIMFPRIVDNMLVAVKLRGMGAKCFGQWAHMDPKALFNSDEINALEPVFVTEGEFDTAIFKQAGFVATSIPNASTKLTPEMKVVLKRAGCIFLAGDNDGTVGNAKMLQLSKELAENTYMIVWPGAKDANEYFLVTCKRDINLFRKNILLMAERAKATPIVGFTSLLQRLRSTGGTDAGKDPNRMHFELKELDDMNYNPSGSIVVFYSTYSGTGKTIFTTQVMVHEAKRGEVVVVYSPELRDEQYLALIASQTLGERPEYPDGLNRAQLITKEQYEKTAALLERATFTGEEFRYYVGHALPCSDTDEVLDFIEQTIRVTGCTRFVIDTLHRVIVAKDRENMVTAEGRVVKALEALGIKYGTIFVLIGQSNKEAEAIKELRHDSEGILRGSRELLDVSYGVYLLHRKKKQMKDGQTPDDILELETDVILKKDRGKGPGKAICRLIYKPNCSKFYLRATNTGPEPSQPQLTDVPQDPNMQSF